MFICWFKICKNMSFILLWRVSESAGNMQTKTCSTCWDHIIILGSTAFQVDELRLPFWGRPQRSQVAATSPGRSSSMWMKEGGTGKQERTACSGEGTRSELNTFDIQRQAGIHLQIEFTVQCWIVHEINYIKRVFGWDAPQSHGSVSESLTESQRSECELKVVVFMRSETTFILKLSSVF